MFSGRLGAEVLRDGEEGATQHFHQQVLARTRLGEGSLTQPRAGGFPAGGQSRSLAESINICRDASGCGKGTQPFGKARSTARQ